MATMQKVAITIVVLTVLLAGGQAYAYCFNEAGGRYNLSPRLLQAMAMQESSLRANLVHQDGQMKAYGLMGIRESWLPRLTAYGIGARDLLEPCTNVLVGAWILAQNVARLGMNWNAVGAFNVGCKRLPERECKARRMEYAMRVYRHMARIG